MQGREITSPAAGGALVRLPRLALSTALVLLALLAVAPAAAMAVGQVAIVNTTPPSQRLQFTDLAGDTNNVTIAQSGTTFTVTDTGAIITEASPDCSGNGTNTVVCTDPDITSVGASLANGNDRIVNDTLLPASAFNGGAGQDTLIGSAAEAGSRESIFGGPDGDILEGRGGAENLFGDEGVDDIDGGPGSDTLDGGDEADAVAGGEGDDNFQGDRDDASDVLDGGPGDDSFTITRFPFGADQGDDVMDGGPGIDDVSMEDSPSSSPATQTNRRTPP